MKKAVMYGAGNIGRGFIGKVFSDSGYQVCFLDIDQAVISRFNKDKEYDVRIVSDESEHMEKVTNVYAVDANTADAVEEIANCDIMATAVGVNVLPYIIQNIANGVKKRIKNGKGPLDIILAENQLDADELMRGWISRELNVEECAWADENLGLVEASIGRMVPPLAQQAKEENPLQIAVEPYAELPVDSCGFKGEIPELIGLKPFTPFGFYIKRKLFLHNMGHAMCAYLGWPKGYAYISQAIRDEEIRGVVADAMGDIVEALHKEYPQIPKEEIEANKDDLLFRFRNSALKDTCSRVAADPLRKLRTNDRLVGAALYCTDWDVEPASIVSGIIAALQYNNEDDDKARELQDMIRQKGMEYILRHRLGLPPDSEVYQMIMERIL